MTGRLIRTCASLGLFTLLGLALLFLLVRSPLFQSVTILFYRGFLLCIVVAVLVALAASLLWRRRWMEQMPLVIAAAALSFSANLSFLIVIPVTIDRSISVFLLAGIEAETAQGRAVTPERLQSLFVDRYVVGMRQIDRRIDEQSRSGNIVVEQGEIHLTPRGQDFVGFARMVAEFWGTDPRFVSGDAGPVTTP